MNDAHVATKVGEFGDRTVRPLNRWLYIRRCRMKDTYTGTNILRPDEYRDQTAWFEILAKGTRAGTPYSKRERRKLIRDAKHMALTPWPVACWIEVGDLVLLTDTRHPDYLWHSPLDGRHKDFVEYLAHEAIILSVYRPEKGNTDD